MTQASLNLCPALARASGQRTFSALDADDLAEEANLMCILISCRQAEALTQISCKRASVKVASCQQVVCHESYQLRIATTCCS